MNGFPGYLIVIIFLGTKSLQSQSGLFGQQGTKFYMRTNYRGWAIRFLLFVGTVEHYIILLLLLTVVAVW